MTYKELKEYITADAINEIAGLYGVIAKIEYNDSDSCVILNLKKKDTKAVQIPMYATGEEQSIQDFQSISFTLRKHVQSLGLNPEDETVRCVLLDTLDAFETLDKVRLYDKEQEFATNELAKMDEATKTKYENLKKMHEDMKHLNNEDGYFEWVVQGIPDCPSKWDLIEAAEKPDSYNRILKHYYRVKHEYEKDGWYDHYQPQFDDTAI